MKQSIIKNSEVFDDYYYPSILVGRKTETKQILGYLESFSSGNMGKNIYVFGPSGVGKTTTIRSVLSRFHNNSVFVNCWTSRTSHKIMEDILRQLGFVIHGRESTTELVKKFENSKKRNVIICLDEVDHIKDHDVFYVFARNPCCLVLISNSEHMLLKFDARIKSRLNFHVMQFEPYENNHIQEILSERVEKGFHDDVLDFTLDDVSKYCNGDARSGIQILRNAAIDAESNNLSSITSQEILMASRNIRKYRVSYLLQKLNEHQKTLYEILKENKSIESGKLFDEYCKKSDNKITDRSYRNYMQKMVEFGLVKEISSGRWKKYSMI
ncbi:Cdc6/Cdc18 family protein [Nitrosarchaeum sp. AC2]|uniref:Cdc6/Cdc18 family protein n=1 Tax=Nitrosarchaeum sp. AC2 TaxID=2259673 RepID=UPI0015CD7804|nr:Cdc6/Cdc18 family protein [Nitrosarchaeum sp. AC2]QLH11277.1 hypothetical protein DSQ20_07235 [Nitrosarchaeum sp. AC2]